MSIDINAFRSIANQSPDKFVYAHPDFSLNGAKVDDRRVFAAEDLIDGRVALLRQGKKNNFLLKVQ